MKISLFKVFDKYIDVVMDVDTRKWSNETYVTFLNNLDLDAFNVHVVCGNEKLRLTKDGVDLLIRKYSK